MLAAYLVGELGEQIGESPENMFNLKKSSHYLYFKLIKISNINDDNQF